MNVPPGPVTGEPAISDHPDGMPVTVRVVSRRFSTATIKSPTAVPEGTACVWLARFAETDPAARKATVIG